MDKLKQERDTARIKAQEVALERQYSRWKVPTQLRTSQQIRSNPEAREAAYARHALRTSLAQVRYPLAFLSYRAQTCVTPASAAATFYCAVTRGVVHSSRGQYPSDTELLPNQHNPEHPYLRSHRTPRATTLVKCCQGIYIYCTELALLDVPLRRSITWIAIELVCVCAGVQARAGRVASTGECDVDRA